MSKKFPGPDERVVSYADGSGNILMVAEYMGAPLRGIVFSLDESMGYEKDKMLLLGKAEDMPVYATMYDTVTLPDLIENMRFPVSSELESGFDGMFPKVREHRRWLGISDEEAERWA